MILTIFSTELLDFSNSTKDKIRVMKRVKLKNTTIMYGVAVSLPHVKDAIRNSRKLTGVHADDAADDAERWIALSFANRQSISAGFAPRLKHQPE